MTLQVTVMTKLTLKRSPVPIMSSKFEKTWKDQNLCGAVLIIHQKLLDRGHHPRQQSKLISTLSQPSISTRPTITGIHPPCQAFHNHPLSALSNTCYQHYTLRHYSH